MTQLSPTAKKVASQYFAPDHMLHQMDAYTRLEFEGALWGKLEAEIRREAERNGLVIQGDIWHAKALDERGTVYRAKAIADIAPLEPERRTYFGWD